MGERGTAATRRLFAWLRNVSLDTALCRVCHEVRAGRDDAAQMDHVRAS